MTSLATAADLAARGIVSTFDEVDVYLATASSVVRDAAGVHISSQTSTVTLSGYAGEQWLTLPGAPIVSVATVQLDGETITDWRLADGRLWRQVGFGVGRTGAPSAVRVTYTHGLTTVPAHIVDLVCAMVAAAKAALDGDADGLGLALDNGRLQSVTVDGFTEAYATSSDAISAVTAMVLPPRTREWLALQFGGGVSTLVSR